MFPKAASLFEFKIKPNELSFLLEISSNLIKESALRKASDVFQWMCVSAAVQKPLTSASICEADFAHLFSPAALRIFHLSSCQRGGLCVHNDHDLTAKNEGNQRLLHLRGNLQYATDFCWRKCRHDNENPSPWRSRMQKI